MAKTKNKFAPVIFLLTAFVCFAVYFSLAMWWNSLQQTKSPKPQTIATTKPQPEIIPAQTPPANQNNGWQTYTNANYGFQINYPDNFQIPSQVYNNSDVTIGNIGLSIQQLHKTNGIFSDSTLSNRSGKCLLTSRDTSLPPFFYFKGIKNIGQIEAYYYVNYPNVAQRFCFNASKCFYYDIYRISHNNNCYEIIYQRSGGPIEMPDNISQIISTFKFTN